MNEIWFHEGELNIMELLWSNEALAAKDIAQIIQEYVGWKKNTTYTVIHRLIGKGAVIREDPGFLCRACVAKQEVQASETNRLLQNLFGGSLSQFITDYLEQQVFNEEEFRKLEELIGKYRKI